MLMQPDCTVYTDLPYSPYAFEHLEGMKDRHKLPGTAELGLKNAITYQDNVEEYGHRVYEAFQQVRTSHTERKKSLPFIIIVFKWLHGTHILKFNVSFKVSQIYRSKILNNI